MIEVTGRLATMFALSVLVYSAGSAMGSEGNGWYASFEEARQVANDTGQPLLLHFHASWCGPCRRMTREVFKHSDVQRQLRSGMAAAEVDVTHHSAIAQQFGASTVPRDVVVFPDGTTETLNIGYIPRSAYLTMLGNVANRGLQIVAAQQQERERQQEYQRKQMAAEPKPIVAEQAAGNNISEQPLNQKAAVAKAGSPIGLEGYCPVRLRKNREWVKGQPDLTETHHGIVYYFSGQAELQEFQSNKDVYAPQNLGCDTVVLLSEHQAVTGRIRYGAFFDGRLYLFNSPENRTEFKANPLRYTHVRHAVKVDQLIGQRFQ